VRSQTMGLLFVVNSASLLQLLLVWCSCKKVMKVSATAESAVFSFEDCPAASEKNVDPRIDEFYYYDMLFDSDVPNSCESPTGNHRGLYTSHFLPCEFTFHKSAAGDDDRGPFQPSTACQSANNLLLNVSVREYIREWPDECVGSFPRCYSLKVDRAIIQKFMCRRRWTLPNGTTHMTVNCTQDSGAWKSYYNNEHRYDLRVNPNNTEFKRQKKEMVTEAEIVGFSVFTFMTLMCLVCCVFAHRWVISPFASAMREAKPMRAERLIASSDHEADLTTTEAEII